MTQEPPEQPANAPVVCDECYCVVRLERDKGALIARCECDKRRSVEQAALLPVSW